MFGRIITNYFRKRAKKLFKDINDAQSIQENIFKHLVHQAKDTAFGQEHHFSSIKNLRDFQTNIPVRTYEEIYPYIERCRKGEENVLWRTPFKWYAKSSGTTNDRSKYIPVSPEFLKNNHLKAGRDVYSIYTHLVPETKVFSLSSRNLVLGGSQKVSSYSKKNKVVREGDVSAIILKNLPAWAQLLTTPNDKIALEEDYEVKIEKMAHAAIKANITSISGVPTWAWVLIQRVLELSGGKTIQEIWPNIELFVHGAVNFDPYRTLFQKTIQNTNMHYVETYNSSEGFFAIQDRFENADLMLLTNHDIFYEFIPMENIHDKAPKVLTLKEVEINKPYALTITTSGGLWRYMVGDTVEFKTINPYRIRITGRTKHFINAFGEELMVENAEQALQAACAEKGVFVRDFTACPIYLDKKKSGAHQWLIEFEKEPVDLASFAQLLDDKLRDINSDYDAKRAGDMALECLKIESIPKNTFYKWMKKRNKLGGQNKVPRLSNDRKIVDDILNMVQSG